MSSNREHMEANRAHWDEAAGIHPTTEFYDVPGFKRDKRPLDDLVLAQIGDVAGQSVLHLQCHFGLDTLAWARHGAIVTGADLSDQSIALAQSLSGELNIPTRFVCSDLLTLPEVLDDRFDIVFTSYGVLHWLRDLPIHCWPAFTTADPMPGGCRSF